MFDFLVARYDGAVASGQGQKGMSSRAVKEYGLASRVLRYMWLTVIGALLGAMAACGVVFVVPGYYTATALIEVKVPKALAPSQSTFEAGQTSADAAFVALFHIAHSDFLQQHLAEFDDFASNFDVDNNLDAIVKVRRRGLTHLAEVVVTLKNPEKAADIANHIAQSLVENYANHRSGIEDSAKIKSDDQAAALRQAAVRSARAAADYKATHGSQSGAADQSALVQRIAPMRSKLEAAQAHYNMLKRATPQSNGLDSEVRSPLLSALMVKYADQKQQYSKLSVIYGPRHPSLQQVEQTLHVLTEQMKGEFARLAAGALAEVEALQKQINQLEADGVQPVRTHLLDSIQVEMTRLEDQAAADKQAYDNFFRRGFNRKFRLICPKLYSLHPRWFRQK